MVSQSPVDSLIQCAFTHGVGDACMIASELIRVEEELARICKDPGCPGYGQGANCPPHVMKPQAFRKLLEKYPEALTFKFDVPTAMLLGDERFDVARIVHETAADLEQHALRFGYAAALGLAASSCKRIFCREEKDCRVLAVNKGCRHPNAARPSISGLGINFFELSRTVGWPIHKITNASDPAEVPMGLMAGIVLLAREHPGKIEGDREAEGCSALHSA
jgi:predicted metal-binding protein